MVGVKKVSIQAGVHKGQPFYTWSLSHEHGLITDIINNLPGFMHPAPGARKYDRQRLHNAIQRFSGWLEPDPKFTLY